MAVQQAQLISGRVAHIGLRTIRICRFSLAPSDPSLTLYIEHREDLVNYASRLLQQDRSRAEDVVQEAWIRLSSRYGRGAEILNPLNYLYSIVRNLAIDIAKRKPWETVADTGDAPYDAVPDRLPTAEDVVLHRDQMRLLAEAIDQLPARTQAAFRMYRLEEKTLQEIADQLNISVARTFQLVRDAGAHATRHLLAQPTNWKGQK